MYVLRVGKKMHQMNVFSRKLWSKCIKISLLSAKSCKKCKKMKKIQKTIAFLFATMYNYSKMILNPKRRKYYE